MEEEHWLPTGGNFAPQGTFSNVWTLSVVRPGGTLRALGRWKSGMLLMSYNTQGSPPPHPAPSIQPKTSALQSRLESGLPEVPV